MGSPNSSGRLKDPPFIVVHSSASGDFDSTVEWLCRRASKRAYHYLIGRQGELVQLVPLDKQAWHAGGDSRWRGYKHLTHHSIGLGLVSWGALAERQGKFYPAEDAGPEVPQKEVHDGAPPEGGARYWQTFTKPQLRQLQLVVAALRRQFPSIVEVVGHRDISPGRKMDPWPLDVSRL